MTGYSATASSPGRSREFAVKDPPLGRAGRVFRARPLRGLRHLPLPRRKRHLPQPHLLFHRARKPGRRHPGFPGRGDQLRTIFACDAKRNRIRVEGRRGNRDLPHPPPWWTCSSSRAGRMNCTPLPSAHSALASRPAVLPGMDELVSLLHRHLGIHHRGKPPLGPGTGDSHPAVPGGRRLAGRRGDWLDLKPSFPGGMEASPRGYGIAGFRPRPLARSLHLREVITAREGARRMAPEARGQTGRRGMETEPLWSSTFYALDVYNDEFLYHMHNVFDTALNRWKLGLVSSVSSTPRP